MDARETGKKNVVERNFFVELNMDDTREGRDEVPVGTRVTSRRELALITVAIRTTPI